MLIQGASSGVGLMAMQIAKYKGARPVIGSSTDATRRGRLKEFGADLAVDSHDPGWVDEVLKATDGEGVDLIVDQVSGKVANQNLKATKIKGRIVNVGRLGGTHADFNFDLHAARRINYIGVTFRTRTIEEIREIFDEVRKDIWPRGGIAKTAIADRQGVFVRRHRQGVRAHGSQQAPRQDRGDAVGRKNSANPRARDQARLRFDGALNRIDRAAELSQHTISGGIGYPAPVISFNNSRLQRRFVNLRKEGFQMGYHKAAAGRFQRGDRTAAD